MTRRTTFTIVSPVPLLFTRSARFFIGALLPMKKKTVSASRPQPAQIQAIERCLERGDVNEAQNRLLRLQTAFPNFKPLRRLAFEVALEGRRIPDIVAAAWDWCEASSNSADALGALSDVSQGRYPYLFYHAAKRRRALGESVPDKILELYDSFSFEDSLDEEDGLRLDLSRAFMGAGRLEEARMLVETLDYPVARNNFAQILFAEGDIARAAEILESVLAKNPANSFALYRLATLRLWLSGKTAAADLNERLQAATPARLDELRYQMESAMLFDQVARVDEIYRSAPDIPWYGKDCEYDRESSNTNHHLGAMAAWRLGDHPEAIRRLRRIGKDDDRYREVGDQCLSASLNQDTPDWVLGDLSQWWPMSRIVSLHPKKLKKDADLFDNWQVPMPHFDYLAAVAVNGGRSARDLALSAVIYLMGKGGDLREGAKRTLFTLLRLPCGPDSVRSQIQGMMIDEKMLDGEASTEIFLEGRIIKTQLFTTTIMDGPTEEETVLDAADAKRYGRALDYLAGGDLPKALEAMEDLLCRYPDYPRILTATASLRRGNDDPPERWAPLIRRAAEIAPDYFFSRIGMALLLATENRIEAARESLKPLLEQKEMHRSEWQALIGAQIAIAQAEDNSPAVARLKAMLQDFDRSRE
jgi:tetratricopeptide (TPR) repeat protein